LPYKFETSPDVDYRLNCLNTSIMRVRCERLDGGVSGVMRRGWKGVVECWGQVEHLRVVEKENVIKEVVDDV